MTDKTDKLVKLKPAKLKPAKLTGVKRTLARIEGAVVGMLSHDHSASYSVGVALWSNLYERDGDPTARARHESYRVSIHRPRFSCLFASHENPDTLVAEISAMIEASYAEHPLAAPLAAPVQ